jgi:hypothetical protein
MTLCLLPAAGYFKRHEALNSISGNSEQGEKVGAAVRSVQSWQKLSAQSGRDYVGPQDRSRTKNYSLGSDSVLNFLVIGSPACSHAAR